jgi:hypothetical protein
LDPEAVSAHGLRAGYRAEAAQPSIASVQGATSYYNEAERAQGGKAGLKGNCQLTICEAAMALG